MKQLLTIFCIMGISLTHAQEPQKQETKEERQQRYIEEVNPFRELGYKPKISTLSKGKYREAFPDSIVQIGNFTYNILEKRITGVTLFEEIGISEATAKPDIVSRWMSPDPLSDEFPDKSPYNFVNNNPIYFIDPTGLAPVGIFDDYGLDKETGKISLIKKTNDNTDTLYAGTGEGELFVKDRSKGSVTVNQYADGSSVVSDLSVENATIETVATGEDTTKERTTNITHTNNSKDAFNVFKFVADNSNVEWSLHKFTMDNNSSFLYQIGTYHEDNLSPGFSNQGRGTWLGAIHSHPNQNTAKDRSESLYGDRSAGSNYLRKYGNNLTYRIYFPSTGTASSIQMSNDPLFPNAVTIKNNITNYKF